MGDVVDTVLVVSGGASPEEVHDAVLPSAPYVIAADSGVALAHALGLRVDEAIGDFDSANEADQTRVRREGGTLRRHPEAKDATDLELALAAAAIKGPRRILVIGSAGGRLDHLLAGVLLLASPRWSGIDATRSLVEAQLGRARVTVVRRRVVLEAAGAGQLVSLLAVGGPALGVSTSGLLYETRLAELGSGSSLGVSNEFLSTRATVSVREGVVVAIQPGVFGTHVRDGLGPTPELS